jgi:hypothetical protein
MSLNENGIVQVAATDVSTGTQANTTIAREYLANGGASGGAADRMAATMQID